MRDELGDHSAENKQRSDGLANRDRSRGSDRYDVAIPQRGCGYEAEVQGTRESLQVGANR